MLPRVDIISGGFPCVDISNAGKRAGITGKHSGLWRAMVRAIRVVRPKYAVVENVAALLGRGMGRVLGDLAESGYDAEWDCLPAAAFGTHFLRDRVFIIAKGSESNGARFEGGSPQKIGIWGPLQFTGLLRRQIQLAVPAGRYGRISVRVPAQLHRLRGLGNAVVPQIAEWIGKRIIECQEELKKP